MANNTYNIVMDRKDRQSTRYKEIGRINAPTLCAIPGILDDISINGCKVHYQFPVTADLEEEYEIKLSPSSNSDEPPLNLICKPQWVKEQDGNTYIGFQILYSPDVNRLSNFISYLKEKDSDDFLEIK